jgi:hypothetical protein
MGETVPSSSATKAKNERSDLYPYWRRVGLTRVERNRSQSVRAEAMSGPSRVSANLRTKGFISANVAGERPWEDQLYDQDWTRCCVTSVMTLPSAWRP